MRPRQTALGRLLQERRESAGFSRTRIGELVGIKAGTIEGWELGRVARPPIHDVLRLSHFLRIPAEEIQRVVFDDAGEAPPAEESSDEEERKPAGVRNRVLFGCSRLPAASSAGRTSRRPPTRSASRRGAWEAGDQVQSGWGSPSTSSSRR